VVKSTTFLRFTAHPLNDSLEYKSRLKLINEKEFDMKIASLILSLLPLLGACSFSPSPIIAMPSGLSNTGPVLSDSSPTTDEYARYRFEKIDKDQSGNIDLYEFLEANRTWLFNNPVADTKKFQFFDQDKDNHFNRYEHGLWLADIMSVRCVSTPSSAYCSSQRRENF
jgi:hypothetical protein